MKTSYKQLLPLYRAKFQFVRECLCSLSASRPITTMLHLGCGEGDYDSMLSSFTLQLSSCDANSDDVRYASQLNGSLHNVTYRVEDGQSLSFPDNSFDVIVSVDVYEHVDRPERLIAEVRRMLKSGGTAIITFPTVDFPLFYDPLNRLLLRWGRHLPVGAYAYGHNYLPRREDFEQQIRRLSLSVIRRQLLGGSLAGLAEMYWAGFLQRCFKVNASNREVSASSRFRWHPLAISERWVKLTDLLLALDEQLYHYQDQSVVTGYMLSSSTTDNG